MFHKSSIITALIKSLTTLMFIFSSTFSYGQKTNKQIVIEKPFVLGVIDEIQSAVLAEKRILNIFLPAGYNKNDTVKYPVVYLLDGSADEDFIHVVGLYQFYNFPWINRVPKSIVVGIATIDRRRDFTYPTTIEADKKRYPTTGNSEKFINFIQKELQPYIEKKYKTIPSKTIIGQSLGGLLATEILLKKSELFNQYIIISPSIWWDNGSILKLSSSILSESYKPKTGIYIGVGKEGLVPGNNPRVMEVDANLLAEKIKSTKSKSVTVYFDYLPDEDHATISHQAISNALKLLHPINPNNK
jgi:predicted alpha/beta superfamily hydrolase